MPINDGSQDIITVRLGGTEKTLDVVPTAYRITKDFFGGASSFDIVFEDDRADQLMDVLAYGMRVEFIAQNSGQQIMIGFVDDIIVHPGRSTGKSLQVQGRDALGMLIEATLYPNLGDTSLTTTFQFHASDTLQTVVKTIFQAAPNITKYLINKDAAQLKATTGFGVGIRSAGKTGRGMAKSFQSNLGRLLKPEKGETYYEYAVRICKRAGCVVRMAEGTDDTIFVGPPTYDRDNDPGFKLKRYRQSNLATNVIDGRMKVGVNTQPSIIIAESSHGGPTFSKQTTKVICANEFTAYERKPNLTLTRKNARPSVQNALDSLTSGTTGYVPLAPNQDLYNVIPQIVADVQTIVSRPKYVVDYNSQTQEELEFYVAELMAHYQDSFFSLDYEVQGHGQNGAFWAPNMMVSVLDESFHPSKSVDGKFWIRRVEFARSRSQGCTTRLTLNLPYIHVYDVTG